LPTNFVVDDDLVRDFVFRWDVDLQIESFEILLRSDLAFGVKSVLFPFAFGPYLRLALLLVSLHFLVLVVHVVSQIFDVRVLFLLFVSQ
jgi:hypothetical protein